MNGQHKDAGKFLSHKQEVTITEGKYTLIFRVHEGERGWNELDVSLPSKLKCPKNSLTELKRIDS